MPPRTPLPLSSFDLAVAEVTASDAPVASSVLEAPSLSDPLVGAMPNHFSYSLS